MLDGIAIIVHCLSLSLSLSLSLAHIILSVMVCVGFWAEFEWDQNLNQFVATVDDVNGLVGDIQTQVSYYLTVLIKHDLLLLI